MLFWGTTGVVLEVAGAAFNTSEGKLARQLDAMLPSEDVVVVADSANGTDVDVALVRLAKAVAVFRHHARGCDFPKGKKLG